MCYIILISIIMDRIFNNNYGNTVDTSLIHCLGLQHDHEDHGDIPLIKKSPYYTIENYQDTLSDNASTFSLLSINIQSLNSKFDELQIIIDDVNSKVKNNVSAIVIQETWFSDTSDLSLFEIDGYNLINQKAVCSRHAGLCIYLHCDFNYNILPLYKESHFWEGLFIEIFSDKYCGKIKIGNIYRKPIYTNESIQVFLNDLLPILDEFNTGNGKAIIAGDFNINLLNINEKAFVSNYFDSMLCKNFCPQITLPTRITARSGTLIDNIFCKLTADYDKFHAGILATALSDHFGCFLNIELSTRNSELNDPLYITVNKPLFNSLDNFKNDMIAVDLLSLVNREEYCDPNINYNIVHDILKKNVKKNFPATRVKFNKRKHKKQAWITAGLIKSINFRDRLYRNLKTLDENSEIFLQSKQNLKTFNNILKQTINNAKAHYFTTVFNKYKTDARKTWAEIKCLLKKQKSSNTLPKNFVIGNTKVSNLTKIVNGFNRYFSNVGLELARKIPTMNKDKFKEFLNQNRNNTFGFKLITEKDVLEIIGSLKSKNSSGFDSISNNMLKSIKETISPILAIIINQSISTGIFPKRLKVAKILPLYKKNDKSKLENYRPISLLPSISKIFEKILFTWIYLDLPGFRDMRKPIMGL